MKIKNSKCMICDDLHVKDINKMLIEQVSVPKVAAKYGYRNTTMYRHRNKHVVRELVNGMAVAMPDFKDVENKKKIAEKLMKVTKGKGVKGVTPKRHPKATKRAEYYIRKYKELLSPIDDLGLHLKFLYDESVEVMLTAKVTADYPLLLTANKSARACLELVIRGQELIVKRSQDDELDRLVANMLDAVEAYPEARKAIAERLIGE